MAAAFPGSGRLEGRVALITGGDSGIGRAIAALFAREGADVAIAFLEDTPDARATAAAVEAEGRRAVALEGDVADPVVCERAVGLTIEQLGRLDVLVSNAAEQHPASSVEAIELADFDRTMRTNTYGYFLMTRAALPHIGPGGSIINTTSITAYRGSPQLVDVGIQDQWMDVALAADPGRVAQPDGRLAKGCRDRPLGRGGAAGRPGHGQGGSDRDRVTPGAKVLGGDVEPGRLADTRSPRPSPPAGSPRHAPGT